MDINVRSVLYLTQLAAPLLEVCIPFFFSRKFS